MIDIMILSSVYGDLEQVAHRLSSAESLYITIETQKEQ